MQIVEFRWYFFFFFQAEDGIRDDLVTGVQTCALPISEKSLMLKEGQRDGDIEVLTINEISGTVQVNNTGTIMSLTFEKDGDRKSTRLNSSHQIISYAVFCLKKKIIEYLCPRACGLGAT